MGTTANFSCDMTVKDGTVVQGALGPFELSKRELVDEKVEKFANRSRKNTKSETRIFHIVPILNREKTEFVNGKVVVWIHSALYCHG